MKKRFLILLLMLFTAAGVIACTPTTGEETTTPTSNITTETPTDLVIPEEAGIPTNLAITGKVLTWSAAGNATGYIVYVDGVEQTTVTTTTYDFTALTGDGLVFTVASVGAQGYEDSHQSASVAYVANPTQEVTDISAYITLNMPSFDLPTAAIEEMVRKGVILADFEADITAIMTFAGALETAAGDPALIKTALETLIASLDNYEAYISAVITVLPAMMDPMIDSMEDQIAALEADNLDGSYDDQIAAMNDQLDMIVNLQTALVTNSDQIVVALTNVVTYLIDFEAAIESTLFNTIVDMTSDGADPTPTEIVTLKDDIADLLLDNLPSAGDIGLLYQVVILLEAAVMETPSAPLLAYANEFGYSCVLNMEFVLELLKSFDVTFVNETIVIVESAWSDDKKAVENSIHVMLHVANFVDTHQTLITNMEAVFTEADKTIFFDETSALLNTIINNVLLSFGYVVGDTMGMGSIAVMMATMGTVFENLEYSSLSGMTAIMESQMEKIVDYLVTTDGRLLRLIGFSNGFEYDYELGYVNSYEGDEYTTITEWLEAEDDAKMAVIEEILLMLDSTIATLTDAETGAIIDFYATMLPLEMIISNFELDMTVLEMQSLLTGLTTVLKAQDQVGMLLINSLLDYIVSESVFDDLAAMQLEMRAYYVSEYGVDYYNNVEFIDDQYGTYYEVIFFSGLLDGFMGTTNLTALQAMITAGFTYMKTPAVLDASGLTIDAITAMETNINGMITQILDLTEIVKTYDFDTLTPDQIENIHLLMALFEDSEEEPYVE